MTVKVCVAGVGLVRFLLSVHGGHCEQRMAELAARAALADADIDFDLVDAAYIGFSRAGSGKEGEESLLRLGACPSNRRAA